MIEREDELREGLITFLNAERASDPEFNRGRSLDVWR